MPRDRSLTAPYTRVAYRAKFRDLVLSAFGERQVVKMHAEIDVRPLSRRSDLYGIFWAQNGRRLGTCGHSLRDAKASAEAMFVEKVEDWQEVPKCYAR